MSAGSENENRLWLDKMQGYREAMAERNALRVQVEQLRAFAETVIALTRPMDPPAGEAITDEHTRSVLLNLACVALAASTESTPK